jgi:hypothetical protein
MAAHIVAEFGQLMDLASAGTAGYQRNPDSI